jgi:hypothetical protein
MEGTRMKARKLPHEWVLTGNKKDWTLTLPMPEGWISPSRNLTVTQGMMIRFPLDCTRAEAAAVLATLLVTHETAEYSQTLWEAHADNDGDTIPASMWIMAQELLDLYRSWKKRFPAQNGQKHHKTTRKQTPNIL